MRRLLALAPLLLLTACGGKPATSAPVAPPAVPAAPSAAAPGAGPAEATTAQAGSAAATPSAVTGPQYAVLKSTKPSTREITYDLVEWYEGKAAVKACAADGEEPAENDWCTGYYVRNNNKKLRTVKVAADAKIRVVVNGEPKPAGLKTLDSGMLFKFTIKNGQVVELEHIFLP
ncbi:hypothetical protein AB0G04_08335 [Actinoplanes sp. NPDC023801]|uniref:hypothetical protein n=1 Tax=Actinoplanes sp. NPDC023801 TaxID=3154595 RepID=UPI0033D580AD